MISEQTGNMAAGDVVEECRAFQISRVPKVPLVRCGMQKSSSKAGFMQTLIHVMQQIAHFPWHRNGKGVTFLVTEGMYGSTRAARSVTKPMQAAR